MSHSHQLSDPPGNLDDHIGLLGHLPSCCCGGFVIGGRGASIVKAAPIGFCCQDLADILGSSATFALISIASAIGLIPLTFGFCWFVILVIVRSAFSSNPLSMLSSYSMVCPFFLILEPVVLLS